MNKAKHEECTACYGTGKSVEWYTAACGMGSYKVEKDCPKCKGSGRQKKAQP